MTWVETMKVSLDYRGHFDLGSPLKILYSLNSVVFEHCMLCVREIYALENVVFCIGVYGPYKP